MVSFEDWVRSELPALLRTATAVSGDAQLAEEIVQDVLVTLSRRWASLEAVDNLRAYVRRMIVNELVSWRRKWARVVPTELLPETATGIDIADRAADRDLLQRELARLPARQQAVLALRYLEGLDDGEIADTLSCAQATVRSIASRALQRLRVEIASTADGAGHKEDSRAY